MKILILTIFVSFVLAFLAILAFVNSVSRGEQDQGDRLSLLPLEEDTVSTAPDPGGPHPEPRSTAP